MSERSVSVTLALQQPTGQRHRIPKKTLEILDERLYDILLFWGEQQAISALVAVACIFFAFVKDDSAITTVRR